MNREELKINQSYYCIQYFGGGIGEDDWITLDQAKTYREAYRVFNKRKNSLFYSNESLRILEILRRDDLIGERKRFEEWGILFTDNDNYEFNWEDLESKHLQNLEWHKKGE